jgi:ribosomal protein S18 acetylase RimI-like enzyme
VTDVTVVRFLLRTDGCERIAAGTVPQVPIEIVAVDPQRDADAVAAVAEACRHADASQGMRLASMGLACELAGRPGRRVHSWLAWPAAGDRGCPLGLVALVESTARAGDSTRRLSIGWLMVHPQARRRGVAVALVRHAVEHGRAVGASEIFVETLVSWSAAVAFWRAVADVCEVR